MILYVYIYIYIYISFMVTNASFCRFFITIYFMFMSYFALIIVFIQLRIWAKPLQITRLHILENVNC